MVPVTSSTSLGKSSSFCVFSQCPRARRGRLFLRTSRGFTEIMSNLKPDPSLRTSRGFTEIMSNLKPDPSLPRPYADSAWPGFCSPEMSRVLWKAMIVRVRLSGGWNPKGQTSRVQNDMETSMASFRGLTERRPGRTQLGGGRDLRGSRAADVAARRRWVSRERRVPATLWGLGDSSSPCFQRLGWDS